MQIEGVFAFQDRGYPGTPLADGGIANRADASGVITAASVGALTVGHVMGTPYDKDGVRFVDVKLLGRPAT